MTSLGALLTRAKHWLGRPRGTPADLPTIDYYLTAGIGDLVGRAGSGKPVERVGPHSFRAHDRLILVRYASDDELQLLGSVRWTSVHYLVDDMLPIAQSCSELPAEYRARLGHFARETLPRILDVATEVIAPRKEILALFPDHSGALLDPAWLHIATKHDHFGDFAAGRAPLRLAFLGTRSHGAGLETLAEIAHSLAARRAPVRLTMFMGKHLPTDLARLAIVDNRRPLDWVAFKAFQRAERFHVMLAPLPDTPFNRGRSITKLMDVAAVGAAGLLADRAPFEGRVDNGRSGLLLGDDPRLWVEAILHCMEQPSQTRALAEGGAQLARRLGDPQRVRAFWMQRMALAPPHRVQPNVT